MCGDRFVYVVMGSAGEYSDNITWPVAAYATRDDAERHETAAMLVAKAYRSGLPARYPDDPAKGRYKYSQDELRAALGDLDPNAETDYTGTDYYTLEVPLREGFKDVR